MGGKEAQINYISIGALKKGIYLGLYILGLKSNGKDYEILNVKRYQRLK